MYDPLIYTVYNIHCIPPYTIWWFARERVRERENCLAELIANKKVLENKIIKSES